MRYIEKQSESMGEWPIMAKFGENFLYFNESFFTPDIKYSKAKTLAKKIIVFIFGILGFLGIFALLFYIYRPYVLYIKLFLISLFFDIVLWTINTDKKYKIYKQSGKIDISIYFSEKSLEIFRDALIARGASEAHPLHILLFLLKSNEGQSVFYRLGVGYREIGQALLLALQNLNKVDEYLSEEFAKIPFEAYLLMKKLGVNSITPNILLGAISQLDENTPTGQIFADYAIDRNDIFNVVRWQTTVEKVAKSRQKLMKFASLKPKGEINKSFTSLPTPILDKFSTDMTRRARYGRTPMIVGREEEVARIFEIFKTGSNGILLVGEHGVGKTIVLESLAQKMVEEDVPSTLFDKRLVKLEIGQILGQGERAQSALTSSLNDASRGDDIVLVIENIHELAQATSSGSSLFSILSSVVTQTKLQLIATTTPQDYQSNLILQSGEVFVRVDISEPSDDDVFLIAGVHTALQEMNNKTFWLYNALIKLVELSGRYIQTGRQPQKAIQAIDAVGQSFSNQPKGKINIITKKDVEDVISRMTHTEIIVEDTNNQHLLNLENILHQRVIGQNKAIKIVSSAMRRIKAHLASKKNRPLASFLFVGPTGVGKTELAKALAESEFGKSENMIRLDMSEYNLPESVEKLLGSRTHTSSFVSQIRERPYSVVLLDEFEKAHAEVMNLFLQVLDEGHLTDNAGSKIDLTNTIIIATSNAASIKIKNGFMENMEFEALRTQLVNDILPEFFKPELINRFDAVVLFRPLELLEVAEIVKLRLQNLKNNLDEKGIKFLVTENGAKRIAESSYDSEYGARAVSRYIQDNIENVVADYLLGNKLLRQDTVLINDNGSVEVVAHQ